MAMQSRVWVDLSSQSEGGIRGVKLKLSFSFFSLFFLFTREITQIVVH